MAVPVKIHSIFW